MTCKKDLSQGDVLITLNHVLVRQFSAHHSAYRNEAWGKSAGPDKILFRPVPVSRNGARVLPHEVLPVPRHVVEIFVQVAKESFVQTSAHA